MKREDEIEIIQYRRPNGLKAKMYYSVGKDYAEKAKGMVFSAQVFTHTGLVELYARWEDQAEEQEIKELAHNTGGDKSPSRTLQKLIDRLLEERK